LLKKSKSAFTKAALRYGDANSAVCHRRYVFQSLNGTVVSWCSSAVKYPGDVMFRSLICAMPICSKYRSHGQEGIISVSLARAVR
jgi:hypothetical protein